MAVRVLLQAPAPLFHSISMSVEGEMMKSAAELGSSRPGDVSTAASEIRAVDGQEDTASALTPDADAGATNGADASSKHDDEYAMVEGGEAEDTTYDFNPLEDDGNDVDVNELVREFSWLEAGGERSSGGDGVVLSRYVAFDAEGEPQVCALCSNRCMFGVADCDSWANRASRPVL